VGQFVDALKTSIINVLTLRGLCGNNCKDGGDTLLDSLYYSSGHLMLLHEILPQVMARKPLMIFLRVSLLLSKDRRTQVLQYLLVTGKCSQ
jgi:hypothetical protein